MIADVRKGLDVCGVYYGHPGVFAVPTHRAIQQARREGYRARMLPGISAEDCLFADLGVDPATVGCQSFEATDFLISQRRFDTTSALVLWQIGAIGVQDFPVIDDNRASLQVLAGYLLRFYAPEHPVIVYEAAWLPLFRPAIRRLPLADFSASDVTTVSTLFVPPTAQRPFEQAMLDALGINPDNLPAVAYALNTDSSAL